MGGLDKKLFQEKELDEGLVEALYTYARWEEPSSTCMGQEGHSHKPERSTCYKRAENVLSGTKVPEFESQL